MSAPVILLLVAAAMLATGCTSEDGTSGPPDARGPSSAKQGEKPIAPPSTQPATLTGTLQGGMMAIGGETTGWTLVGDGAVGGVELDVSKVREQAEQLDGKRVTVTGTWVDKKYVERGTVRQLAVQRIEPSR